MGSSDSTKKNKLAYERGKGALWTDRTIRQSLGLSVHTYQVMRWRSPVEMPWRSTERLGLKPSPRPRPGVLGVGLVSGWLAALGVKLLLLVGCNPVRYELISATPPVCVGDNCPPAEAGAGGSAAPTDAAPGQEHDAASFGGGSGAGGVGSTGGTGGSSVREVPDYQACLPLPNTSCALCCLSTFGPDAVVPDSDENFCLCRGPRPCGTLCDEAHCGETIDLSKESAACYACRLSEMTGAACAPVYARCTEDPVCHARNVCLSSCTSQP